MNTTRTVAKRKLEKKNPLLLIKHKIFRLFLGSSQNAGPGPGCLFFSKFFCLNFCSHSPVMFGIFPSFMVEISQKNMEHTEGTKGTSLFRN